MSKKEGKNENRLYAPIMKALEDKFSKLGECHFDVTSDVLSDAVKENLDDESLSILRIKKMRPDLIGFLIEEKKFNIIVAEVKEDKPTLDDIYQTKKYAETLSAPYALLISLKRTSEDLRRFLMKRKGVTGFSPDLSNNRIFIGLYVETTKSIQLDTQLYEDIIFDENFEQRHYKALFKR